MGDSDIRQENRDDFWCLLDRAFSSLYSCSVPAQKENILNCIHTFMLNLKDWRFFTNVNCASFYSWLVQHFSEILIDQNFNSLHEKVILSCEALLETLSVDNQDLFNEVIQSFLRILQSTLNSYDEILAGLLPYITIRHTLLIPYGVKNNSPFITISSEPCITTLFKCFYQICSDKLEFIIRHAQTSIRDIIRVFLQITEVVEYNEQTKISRIVFLLAAKTVPVFSFEEWKKIFIGLKSIEVDNELIDGFAYFLENTLVTPYEEKSHFLLLSLTIDILCSKFLPSNKDVGRVVQVTKKYFDVIPGHCIKQVNVDDLLPFALSNRVLYELIEKYFYKSVDYFITSEDKSTIKGSLMYLARINATWEKLIADMNRCIHTIIEYPQSISSNLKIIISILSIAQKVNPLGSKYNCDLIKYDLVTDEMFHLLSILRTYSPISKEVLSDLILLSENIVDILIESNPIDITCALQLQDFFLTPWKDSSDKIWDESKSSFYKSLNIILCYSIHLEEFPELFLNLIQLLYEVTLRDKYLTDVFVNSLMISLLHGEKGIEDLLVDYLTKSVNETTIERLIASSFIGHLLPCFFSNYCTFQRDERTFVLRCLHCDFQKKKDRLSVKFNFKYYLEFLCYSYVKILLKKETSTDTKLKLLKNLERYVFHISGFKNVDLLNILPGYISSLSLTQDISLASTLKCFLFNDRGKFDCGRADIIVNEVLKIFMFYKEEEYSPSQNNCFEFLSYVSRLSRKFLLKTIKFFFFNIFKSTPLIIETNNLKGLLRSLLDDLDLNEKQLLNIYEVELSELWVDIIVDNVQRKKCDPEATLTFIARIFNMTLRDFLEFRCTPYMVTYILINNFENFEIIEYLLDILSGLLLMSIKDTIIKCFVVIFSWVYFLDDEICSHAVLSHVEVLSRSRLKTLIYYSYKNLVCYIIMNAHKPLKVFRFFEMYVLAADSSLDKEADVLIPYVLGYLTFVDAKLSSKSSSSYIIQSCLKSIPSLIELLGSDHVAAIRLRFLATLRTGLPQHYKFYPKECVEAWLYFLYSIDVSFLGPYLTVIVTLLKPLCTTYPTVVSKIFHYLVVQNGHLYYDYIPELFFIDDSSVPDMHSVWLEIEKANKDEGIIASLTKTLDHIKLGAMESRIHSLEYMFHLLKSKRHDLLKILTENVDLPLIFEQMVSCLMSNIRNGNSEVKMVCANCLGELGAINPARFGYGHEGVDFKEPINIESEDFAFLTIMELTKSLQKSEDSHSYHTIASSIQEIIKLYFPSQDLERLNNFISRFSRNESDILRSLLGSRYIFTEPGLIKRRVNVANWLSGKNTFEWASIWGAELIASMPINSFARKVFTKCFPGIQLDLEAMEALLPHILLQTLLFGSSEDASFIEMDIKYILKCEEEDIVTYPQHTNFFSSSVDHITTSVNSVVMQDKCVSIILDLIDFLFKYCSFLKISKENTTHIEILSKFLSKFPENVISLKSYKLKDYCRSLFYLESHNSNSLDINIKPLRNIYAKLNDSDGLLGVIRTSRSVPTVEESILNHIVCGNIQDALPTYELLATKHKNSTDYSRALIQCYLNIHSPYVAVNVANSFLNRSSDCFDPTFSSELVETAWKNLMFPELNETLNSLHEDMKNNWSWSIDIGIAYLYFFEQKFDHLKKKVESIRKNVAEHISAVSNTTIGAYRQSFGHILNLQILSELERYSELIKASIAEKSSGGFNEFFNLMNIDSRHQLLPSHGNFIENIMNSRIQVLSMVNQMDEIPSEFKSLIESVLGSLYLKSSKISRKNSNLQLSSSYLALAEMYQPLGLFIEKAKLLEAKHETDTAIYILKQGIEVLKPTNECSDVTIRKLSAQAKLLIARYNEENMNVDYNEGNRGYQNAIDTFPNEKNFVYLAKYLYHIHTSDPAPDSTMSKCDLQVHTIRNFGKSLLYGCKYIYQSMFCMISLWLDYGARFKVIADATKKQPQALLKSQEDIMRQMDSIIDENFKAHPSYMFMAVFSQLISRINHPLPRCQATLLNIISKVAVDFPQQAFWMMVPIWKTQDPTQNKLGSILLDKMKTLPTKSEYPITQFYCFFNELIDILIGICNKKVPHDKPIVPLKSISHKLKALLKKDVKILIPSQKFRTICLPNFKNFKNPDLKMYHNPFPLELVYFTDVEDEVQVLLSLQRPKKLVFKGSDGNSYPFMCKPMDDLRLDSRIMEFCSVVNMYLQRDPSSHDRNLSIKTYSVVPINPVNGLIEWVPNMLGYRSVLIKMFKMRNYKIPNPAEIRAKIESCTTPEQKLNLFREVLLPLHPPVLDKWFFHQFPSPDSWYLARKSFVRSAAVMSIVGYVVGLGDRHGENILLDAVSGEIMHVDFNCLFGRGEFFQVPEIVPFRLTHNMVRAMGSTGIEGHFIKSCEITNRVIRNYSEQLLYVLKPFLYDPKLQKSSNTEEKAKNNLSVIQKKMAGFVLTPKRKTQALSVEGQVRCLVAEATSNINLSQMYHGWNPFL